MLDTSKTYESNSCGTLSVVDYINASRVLVRFTDTGYQRFAEAGAIKLGQVKDALHPVINGVGFIGCGAYKSKLKRKHTKQYIAWRNMLNRCYCPKTQERQPTYKGCTVAEEWHNFQTFAKWFDENYTDGFQLDKDIKIKANKVYSPDNCMFVSRSDNVADACAKNYTFTSPKGVAVDVYNISKFCRDNSLDAGHMIKVHKGQYKQHKGWRVIK
tara:strand:+ start:3880 stop:4521 length:642 start_codon:yes stop_codon:yes gene_type:complete